MEYSHGHAMDLILPINEHSMKMLTSDILYKSLREQFYLTVPFALEPLIIEEAIQAFFKFLNEPDAIKTHIDFSISPQHRRGDIGFKRRDPNEHLYNDSKDFFHFHPSILEKYHHFIETHLTVRDFMMKANDIWGLVFKTTQEIMKLFEPEFPGIYNKIFETNAVHIVLRFLKYNWQSSGKYLAKPHFDAGSFTLAIAESCPGLRIGSNPDDLRLVSHQDKSAVFMFSSNFHKVMPTDKFSPGWHDVIQLNETLIGKPFSRWAIVAFIDGHGVTSLSREETHKWIP